jgi:2,3-bisphosphoglycerate-dependent phosphoglycerate mutase
MTQAYMIRHGATDWNAEHRWQGQTDVPLNEAGRAQAHALGEAFRGVEIDCVYSSDLSRARDTAAAVARSLGAPHRVDDLLRERSFGLWDGLTTSEIKEQYPDRFASYCEHRATETPPEGETWSELVARTTGAIDRIASDNQGGRVAIVAHAGPIRAFVDRALGLAREDYNRYELANAGVSVLRSNGGPSTRWQVVALNLTSHLTGAIPE